MSKQDASNRSSDGTGATGDGRVPGKTPQQRPDSTRRKSWSRILLYGGGVVLLVGILLWVKWDHESHLEGKWQGLVETPTVQNLKALATAQAQYIKQHDHYASSGAALNVSRTLISADFKDAFEQWQGNGDAAVPRPTRGHIYRMLQGEALPTDFYCVPGVPASGMVTWAAIARAVEPGVSGEYQYFITEAGTVYRMPEPKPGEAHFKQFLLERVPAANQTSWQPVK